MSAAKHRPMPDCDRDREAQWQLQPQLMLPGRRQDCRALHCLAGDCSEIDRVVERGRLHFEPPGGQQLGEELRSSRAGRRRAPDTCSPWRDVIRGAPTDQAVER